MEGIEVKKIDKKVVEERWFQKINPNRLTLFRIFLLPLPVALLFLEGYLAKIFSLSMGSLLASTDYLDGFLARKRKEVTPLGALLDPVADKIFVSVLYLTLVHLNYFSFAPVAILLSRELIVALFRSWFPEALRVVEIARIKTFFQMSIVGIAILMSLIDLKLLSIVNYFLWFLAIFSYISAIPYFYRVSKALSLARLETLMGIKSMLSLVFNLTLLLIFPLSGNLFWIIPLSLSFYFFRKGLAKSSPLHAQGESLFLFFLLFLIGMELYFSKKPAYSLLAVLFFSLYRDGIKSLKLIWEILKLK